MPLFSSALVAATVAACGPTPPERVTAFIDVTVIPMDRDRTLANHTVLVRGDRIVEVGPTGQVRVPEGSARVDGRGKFLIPGLAEMHAHLPGGLVLDREVERTLYLYVAGGVTTVRGMLGHRRHLGLREAAARDRLVGPTIYTSGPSLNGKSVPTPEAAAQAAREQDAAGYDFLKIHPGIRREVFDTLAATAHRVGISFAGHVPLDVGLARALEARYATIDHLDGYIEAMLPDGAPVEASQSAFFGVNLARHADESRIPALVAATKQAGVWNVPTETLMENLTVAGSADELSRRPEMRYVSPGTLADWVQAKNSFLDNTGTDAASARRMIELRRKLLKALHEGGAGLLLGSDAPQIFNVPGFSIHRELEAMVAAGLTPYQALETGTRNVAVFFGTLAETGTVERGKRADLILLDADPLQDIRHTTRRAGVMLRGRWMPQAEIEARLAEIEREVR